MEREMSFIKDKWTHDINISANLVASLEELGVEASKACSGEGSPPHNWAILSKQKVGIGVVTKELQRRRRACEKLAFQLREAGEELETTLMMLKAPPPPPES